MTLSILKKRNYFLNSHFIQKELENIIEKSYKKIIFDF